MAWLSKRPPRTEEATEDREVLLHPLGADVLEHADRRDGVELLAVELPVVLEADVDQVVEPGGGHPLPCSRGLLAADRDADDAGLVVLGGVHRQRAPAAADVEQPAPGCLVETELPADRARACRLGPRRGSCSATENRAHEYVIAGPSTMS